MLKARARIVIKNVFFLLFPTVFLFGLGEAIVRLAQPSQGPNGWHENDARLMKTSPRLGWQLRPGFEGITGGTWRAISSSGLQQTDWGDDTVPNEKVFFLGGSVVFGVGVEDDSAFVELTEEELPGVRAFNFGVPGYSTYQGRVRFVDAVRMAKPSAVVVEFGVHDRVGVRKGTVDGPDVFRRRSGLLVNAATELRFRSYLVRLLYDVLFDIGFFRAVPCVPFNEMMPRVSLTAFRENLIAIAELAKQQGARVVFLEIGPSLKAEERYRTAERLINARKYQEVLESFKQNPPDTEELLYGARTKMLHSKALAATGAVSDAHNEACYEEGEGVIVPATPYFQVMKQVADAYDGYFFNASSDLQGEPGLFVDDNHLSAAGHRKLAHVIAPYIKAALATSGKVPGPDQRSPWN